jgi:hypothetical protein
VAAGALRFPPFVSLCRHFADQLRNKLGRAAIPTGGAQHPLQIIGDALQILRTIFKEIGRHSFSTEFEPLLHTLLTTSMLYFCASAQSSHYIIIDPMNPHT